MLDAALSSLRNSFDTTTAEGRSKERYRRIIITALSSASIKGINVLTTLMSVPLTVGYLGAERYGLWMTISSTIAILSFADLGLGNGLLNAVSQANGRDDREKAAEYVSSTFFLLLALALALGLVFTSIYPLISWHRVFNVSSPEAGPAMAIFTMCFLANLPLGVAQRVQQAYQEGFKSNLWQGLGNVLGLLGVLLAIHMKANLPWLVFAMAGAPLIAALANWVQLLRFRRAWLRPTLKRASVKSSFKIFRLGMLFFVLQTAAALAYASDNIIAAHVLGPAAVAEYSIAARLFSLLSMVVGMVLFPMWPAYSEAIARRDTVWVRQTLWWSLKFSVLLSAVPAFFLVVWGRPVIAFWVGAKVMPSILLLTGLGAWTILGSAGNAASMFLNGANVIRFQVICALLMCSSAIALKIVLSKLIGLPGLIWGTIIAYIIFSAIPMAYFLPKFLSKMKTQKH